jgi:hypothetical protein
VDYDSKSYSSENTAKLLHLVYFLANPRGKVFRLHTAVDVALRVHILQARNLQHAVP